MRYTPASEAFLCEAGFSTVDGQLKSLLISHHLTVDHDGTRQCW